MTLDDVRTSGKRAFLPLPNGAILRYQPDDDTVRVLSYACRSEEWERLPILHRDIPSEGWRHALSCVCGRCGSGGRNSSR